MAERAIRYVVREGAGYTLVREAELLRIINKSLIATILSTNMSIALIILIYRYVVFEKIWEIGLLLYII